MQSLQLPLRCREHDEIRLGAGIHFATLGEHSFHCYLFVCSCCCFLDCYSNVWKLLYSHYKRKCCSTYHLCMHQVSNTIIALMFLIFLITNIILKWMKPIICFRLLGQNTVSAYQRAKVGGLNIGNHVTTISGNVAGDSSNSSQHIAL